MKKAKNVIILDGAEIIKNIKSKYGDTPIFSSKYESVKKSFIEREKANTLEAFVSST